MDKCNDSILEQMFLYHPATGTLPGLYGAVRQSFLNLAKFLCALVPDGWEKEQTILKLNEAMFWANAGIARHHEEKPVPSPLKVG